MLQTCPGPLSRLSVAIISCTGTFPQVTIWDALGGVLEPAIFTFCSHHIATDHAPKYTPNVHFHLYLRSYHFGAGLSSVLPLLASQIQAGCVSLVLLINLSGTQPLSHHNGFTELTTLHSLCTPPDALPTLSSSLP